MPINETFNLTLAELLRHAKKNCILLSVSDIAELAKLTPWYVRQLIASGEIRAINVGGTGRRTRWRIDPDDFQNWMVGRENRRRDLTAA
ncbi:MAG TPA: helix-turn-helix domain-containing protein [Plantibacter sp.]|uniref:helix-turn-helix domain-containing protein n=1 Tax=unclassified Plantibacter TaxID=2624265 RepID=UPI002BAAA3AB|nr:helix-turn-helix domain-containing protein [Plantibacter sp.]